MILDWNQSIVKLSSSFTVRFCLQLCLHNGTCLRLVEIWVSSSCVIFLVTKSLQWLIVDLDLVMVVWFNTDAKLLLTLKVVQSRAHVIVSNTIKKFQYKSLINCVPILNVQIPYPKNCYSFLRCSNAKLDFTWEIVIGFCFRKLIGCSLDLSPDNPNLLLEPDQK